ncbi:type I pantothenate kinase [Holzapfeliella floricola]|uniref:Pantothenate kinase n=1 Tax=Holzapfeliella floricola DSM 23037 = JCM 16512 TaxID=1423744 RepID=A0A0R2DKI3_9LACO|nr:type I pantothenate kinase [Holzapfeliella floricola]KRN04624.1 pantothenate kinase [Holzapfeliella floricola DSM 23037 = JCM 16512]
MPIKNYHAFSRADWQDLIEYHFEEIISEDELQELKALNDSISLQDVREIYYPLIELLQIHWNNRRDLHQKQNQFLQTNQHKSPFIIGISGSVAVGKSTTARLLRILIDRLFPKLSVQLMTTDGFLYSNEDLKRQNLTEQKGFPESYDMQKFYEFLLQVRQGQSNVKYPVYSHSIYDIVKDEYEVVNCPDILIIEGINILQLPPNSDIFLTAFFDFSIYLDADEDLIESWFLKRFKTLFDYAKTDSTNFYAKFVEMGEEKAYQVAKDVWKNINLVNLREYIAPTKSRANVILHKGKYHVIDQVLLRKY